MASSVLLVAALLAGVPPAPKAPASRPSIAPKAPSAARMDDARLDVLLRRIDEDAVLGGQMRHLTIAKKPVVVITDARVDRMRIMAPVASASALDEKVLRRMLQANFDAVLDARYAIGQGQVWSVFLHPLGDLTEDGLFSGLAQVLVAAETFGKTYTSGALIFGGGDSHALHEALLEAFRKKGKAKI